MIWVKIIICYISLLPLVVHSFKCLDPETLTPIKFTGVLSSTKAKILNTNTNNLRLTQALLYTLSKDPLVQFVLVKNHDYSMVLQVKKNVYKRFGIKLEHDLRIALDAIHTNDTGDQTFTELLKNYGTSKYKAFDEMSIRCQLLILSKTLNQEHRSVKQMELYLILVVSLIVCYCLHFLFNCVMNYCTLMKVRRKDSQVGCTIAFFSLNQSLTSSRLSKYYLDQSEALYQDLYERMTTLGQSIQRVQDQLKITAELRKVSICTYDYATSCADNFGRPPQPPLRENYCGHITPASIHDYITVVGENFVNIDKVVNELKMLVQNQDGQQSQDGIVEYKSSRRNTTVPAIEEDESEHFGDIRTTSH